MMARVIAFPVERIRPRPPRLLSGLARDDAASHATRALVAYSALAAGSVVMILQLLSLRVH